MKKSYYFTTYYYIMELTDEEIKLYWNTNAVIDGYLKYMSKEDMKKYNFVKSYKNKQSGKCLLVKDILKNFENIPIGIQNDENEKNEEISKK